MKSFMFACLVSLGLGQARQPQPQIYFAGQAVELRQGKAAPIGPAFCLIYQEEESPAPLIRFRVGQDDYLECPVIRKVDNQYYEGQSLLVEVFYHPDGTPDYAQIDLPDRRVVITVK